VFVTGARDEDDDDRDRVGAGDGGGGSGVEPHTKKKKITSARVFIRQ